MALKQGMLLFFDGDPTKDEMAGMMKTLKQKFKKMQTRKREREEPCDTNDGQVPRRKIKKVKTLKRKLPDTETVSQDNDLDEDPKPTDACAMPTIKVRKLPRNQVLDSPKKERKLDSRLKRILKSKQKKSQNSEPLSDECSTASNDSGVHLGCEREEIPVSTKSSIVKPQIPQDSSVVTDIPVSRQAHQACTSSRRSDTDLTVGNICNIKGTCVASEEVHLRTTGRKSCLRESENAERDGRVNESMYVAMDCEFVGVGPKGCRSALGRCSVVDFNGRTLCDIYARPEEPIVDYRTRYSGIRPRHMKTAIPLESARRIVKRIIKGKIVIGHAVWNDFNVLGIQHPPHMIRDTFNYSPLHQMASTDNTPRSLKKLSAALLGRSIQTGPHSSIEDSLATLDLFKLVRVNWEKELAQESDDKAATIRRSRTFSETSEENTFLKDDYWPCDI